jgi:hypothetical protein
VSGTGGAPELSADFSDEADEWKTIKNICGNLSHLWITV